MKKKSDPPGERTLTGPGEMVQVVDAADRSLHISESSERAAVRDDAASSICIDDYDSVDDAGLAHTAQEIIEAGDRSSHNWNDFESYVQKAARDYLNSNTAPPKRLRFGTESSINPLIEPEYNISNEWSDALDEKAAVSEVTDGSRTSGSSKSSTIGPSKSRHSKEDLAADDELDDFFPKSKVEDFTNTQFTNGWRSDSSFFTDTSTNATDSMKNRKKGHVTVYDASSLDDDACSVVTLNIDAGGDNMNTGPITRLARSFRTSDFLWLAFSGGISTNFLVGSDDTLVVSGPLGGLLGYILAAPVIMSVVTSLTEIIAFYPFENGFAAMVSEYVDPSLGFALGLCYWAACVSVVPSELLTSINLLNVFPSISGSSSSSIIWLTFFVSIVFCFGICTTRIFSRAMKVASMISAVCLTMFMIFIWVLDSGVISSGHDRIGLRYWDSTKSEPGRPLGLFRPSYFMIFGAAGRFFQVWHAFDRGISAYTGIEVIYTTMPEIRNSRRTMRSSIRNICLRIVMFYILLTFTYSLISDPNDVTFGQIQKHGKGMDKSSRPNLFCAASFNTAKRFSGEGSFAAWFVAFGRTQNCAVLRCAIAFFIYSAIFASGLRLYGASRTLHGMAAEGMIPKVFAWCTRDQVPMVSIIASLSISLLGYISASVQRSVILAYLVRWSTATYSLTWAVICLSYIRFYNALEKKKHHIPINRSDEDYPYRSPFQPYFAWFGLISCLVLHLALPFENQMMFCPDTIWNAPSFIIQYAPLVCIFILYFGHKYWYKTKIVPYHQMKLDVAKQRMDREEWEEDRVYSEGFSEQLARTYNWAQYKLRARKHKY